MERFGHSIITLMYKKIGVITETVCYIGVFPPEDILSGGECIFEYRFCRIVFA